MSSTLPPDPGPAATDAADRAAETPPDVWVLTDDRPGNRTQALGAAQALGWRFVEKPLAFNALAAKATPRLGATLETIDDASRARLAPPFPRLVIAVGRRTTPVARWIKQASGGAARIVLIGRRTPASGADLTVRAAYLGQARHPGLLELALPLTRVDAEVLARVRAEAPDPLAGIKRPRVVFLVGGPTGQHEMSAAFAARMAEEVGRAADAAGGGLAVLASRRTPPDVIAAIRRASPGAPLREWSAADGPDVYLSYLANAGLLVVTGESESMLAEAVASGRPVTIYPLTPKPLSFKSRLRWKVLAVSRGPGALAALCRKLMADGWVAPRRDLDLMHRFLIARGLARTFDGSLNAEASGPIDERDVLRRRIISLFDEPGA